MSVRRMPVSRRTRPAKPPLSRDGLIAVALRIMREEGLEKATMRRMAAELDTGPASLYVYVRNTAELHGALLDELLTDLPLPASDPSGQQGGQWDDQITDLLTRYTALLLAHPSLARSAVALHPVGPNYLRLIDTVLGLLRAGGVRPEQAAWGVDILFQQATATAAEHSTRDASLEATGNFETLASTIRAAPADTYPHLDRVRDKLYSGTGEARLRWSFRVLLNGIAATPQDWPTTSPPASGPDDSR